MTEGAHFLAVKPLSVKTTRASCADAVILNVMRHNARELQAEIGVGADSGIDASRIHLNVTLHGPATADGVVSAARDAMREHGIVAPRKNATLGIEIVASLPAGLLIDHLAYFRDTAAWAQQHYRVPLLSAIVHNDESSPHLHLVLLPVRDGKLVGSELLGNRATMKAMQKDFHEQVAKQYGLRMPAAKKRHSAAQRAAGIALLRDTLQANSGLTERAIDALLVPHAKNPEPLLVALGLAMPAPVVKGSFVATMTRKVRPESPDRIYKKSPIGHLRAQTGGVFLPENENSYALLGLPISPPNFPPSAKPSSTTDSTPGHASPVHRQASASARPDIACPAPGTAQPSAGTGQQDSAPSAAPQSTTDQQRERSTTSTEHVTPRNAKASHAAPARRPRVSTATPASAPAAPRTSKRKLATCPQTAASSMPAEPSTSTPKRTATLQQVGGTLAQDTLPAKVAPVPATLTGRMAIGRKDSGAPADSIVRRAASIKPAMGKAPYDADADQPDEIRRLGYDGTPMGSRALPTSPMTPTREDALKLEPISPSPCSAGQSGEISAQCSWPKFSGQQHSPEYSGQLQVDQQVSQRAGEDDHHGAPALDWLPMPAPRINDSATARQPATAHEDESGRHDVDSYQRLRDDENAAELWDSDLGEFVTAQARPARRTSTMHTIDAQCADDQGAVWFDARPAVIEAALDSISAVHGQH